MRPDRLRTLPFNAQGKKSRALHRRERTRVSEYVSGNLTTEEAIEEAIQKLRDWPIELVRQRDELRPKVSEAREALEHDLYEQLVLQRNISLQLSQLGLAV